ncbi:MAG: c-type cytochrome [Pseudomonadota bacterium]
MKKLAFAVLVMFGAVSTASAAGDAAAGKTKANTCVACHGADGNSTNPIWPRLAGQHADYTAKQLAEFKSGARKDPTMNGMATPLSEQDMADLAAFFASQSAGVGAPADEEKAARGKALYQGGDKGKGISACMACHGPAGGGIAGAGFPSLSGQHQAYVVKALKDFRSGTRDNDLNGMMRDIAAKMSDADIEAVAEYIAGLH